MRWKICGCALYREKCESGEHGRHPISRKKGRWMFHIPRFLSLFSNLDYTYIIDPLCGYLVSINNLRLYISRFFICLIYKLCVCACVRVSETASAIFFYLHYRFDFCRFSKFSLEIILFHVASIVIYIAFFFTICTKRHISFCPLSSARACHPGASEDKIKCDVYRHLIRANAVYGSAPVRCISWLHPSASPEIKIPTLLGFALVTTIRLFVGRESSSEKEYTATRGFQDSLLFPSRLDEIRRIAPYAIDGGRREGFKKIYARHFSLPKIARTDRRRKRSLIVAGGIIGVCAAD